MLSPEERLECVKARLDSASEHNCSYFSKSSVIAPSRKAAISIIKRLQSIMFPEYFSLAEDEGKSCSEKIKRVFLDIKMQIGSAFAFLGTAEVIDTEEAAFSIVERIPDIKELLIKDIQAIYEGDPAASSPEEIILSYPGFYAISIYRIAHEFYIRKIPCLPRIMTEYAHEKTGIDIHAGATIGEYFFIDHGTGIVIGETTTIGSHVKIYQGVTLGAKSFELDEDGNPVKGIKRHPDIGNNCVIYANATILGGKTEIGDGCTIGGNVWLTHSVPAGQTVYYK